MIKGLLCSSRWFVIWQRLTRQFWIWIKFMVSYPVIALLNRNYVFYDDPQYCCRIYNLRADGKITPSYQLRAFRTKTVVCTLTVIDIIYLLLIAVRCSKVWMVLLYIHSLSLSSYQKILHVLLLTNILIITLTPQFILHQQTCFANWLRYPQIYSPNSTHRHLIHTHSTSAPFYPENDSFDICFGVGVLFK